MLLLLACTPSIESFPEDFRFGTATAGFQVEAGCPTVDAEICEDRNSDWYQWVTDPDLIADGGNFLSGDPMDLAPGHYELYEQDFALAADLNTEVFRFSFEWSRLFPDGAAEQATSVDELYDHVDPVQLEWMHDYIDAMVAAGLEPMATVNHYSLPLWVHDGKECNADPETCVASGWMDQERIVPLIALFSQFCAREFGDDITWWLTLNEPVAVFLSGFILPNEERTNPPGISDMDKGIAVAQAMAAAHGAMAQAIHAEDADAQVGVVINVGQTFPKDPDRPADVTAAEHMAYLYNELIPGLFIDGRVDSNLDGEQDGTLEGVAGQTDWLGLNYYFSFEVIGLGISAFPGYAYMDFFPETLITDVEYLGDAIDISAAYGLPLWITENGIANPTADHPDSFVTPALRITQAKALEHDLHGYLYWSLVDNYEWNHGMGMTFGLYEVDLDTKARTLRPIGERFGQIAGDHGVPALEE